MSRAHMSPDRGARGLSLGASLRLLFKLAGRGLKRDLRRTLITGCAISVGLALFIFSDQIQTGSYHSLISRGVSTQAGHLVIQREGYQERPEQALSMRQTSALRDALDEALSAGGIQATVTARAQLAGLLQSPVGSARVRLLAVDPSREPEVSDWRERLAPASRPQGEEGAPLESSWLEPGDHLGVLLGAKLAARLDLTVGDKVIYTSQRAGQVESKLLRVRGVLRLGSEEEESRTALTTLKVASEALAVEGAAHMLTVHLSSLEQLTRAQAITQRLLEERPALARGQQLTLLPWQEALPMLYQFSLKDQQTSRVIFFLMGLMIAIGVLNTITISALERQRSFGVMRALGLTPRLIGGLIVIEGLTLGLLASLMGLALGALVSWPAVRYGIDKSSMAGGESMELGGVMIDTHIYAVWNPGGLIGFTVTSVLLSVSASLWPAWRVSQTPVLNALRGQDHS